MNETVYFEFCVLRLSVQGPVKLLEQKCFKIFFLKVIKLYKI